LDNINIIKKPVDQEMEIFETKFRDSMKSSVPLLDKITHYIVKRKGKQLRPMFVLLTAKLTGGINESSYRAASLIELLHTATLVHDDVVDDSHFRRGFFSVNALWKNKIAVLVGDYFLSKGLLLSIDNDDFQLLKIVSEAVREMSEGELLQIEKARRLDITEEVYFNVIRQKTASLIAACCAVGAASNKSNADTINRLKRFGELVGLAFQIKDDLFDYGSEEDIGKPVGNDIKEKKMTLPLIYALSKADWITKRKIISIVKNNNNDPEKVKEVIEFVFKSGGIEYATNRMLEIRDDALTLIKSFEDCEAKTSLIELVNYTTNRKK
jgi:octaprenyl-diphosphate synthase